MTIPFRIKLLTKTAKAPTQENKGDLWDLYADDFCNKNLLDRCCQCFESNHLLDESLGKCKLYPKGRILVKTGISIELPVKYEYYYKEDKFRWDFSQPLFPLFLIAPNVASIIYYAVADIRPRSGLALKHGITVLNSPGTIDNSYRKEIGVILYNAGHESYTIKKGDKIAQMLIRPLCSSQMEIVEEIKDTQREGFGSTGE